MDETAKELAEAVCLDLKRWGIRLLESPRQSVRGRRFERVDRRSIVRRRLVCGLDCGRGVEFPRQDRLRSRQPKAAFARAPRLLGGCPIASVFIRGNRGALDVGGYVGIGPTRDWENMRTSVPERR